jgi:hypothetical protein
MNEYGQLVARGQLKKLYPSAIQGPIPAHRFAVVLFSRRGSEVQALTCASDTDDADRTPFRLFFAEAGSRTPNPKSFTSSKIRQSLEAKWPEAFPPKIGVFEAAIAAWETFTHTFHEWSSDSITYFAVYVKQDDRAKITPQNNATLAWITLNTPLAVPWFPAEMKVTESQSQLEKTMVKKMIVNKLKSIDSTKLGLFVAAVVGTGIYAADEMGITREHALRKASQALRTVGSMYRAENKRQGQVQQKRNLDNKRKLRVLEQQKTMRAQERRRLEQDQLALASPLGDEEITSVSRDDDSTSRLSSRVDSSVSRTASR